MSAKGKFLSAALLAAFPLVSACSEEVTNQKMQELRQTGHVNLTWAEMFSGVAPQQKTPPAAKPATVRTASRAPSGHNTPSPVTVKTTATPTATAPSRAPVSTAKRQVVLNEEDGASKVEVDLLN